MLIRAAGILCAARHHGEHGVIARVMTAEHGLLAGYARAGRSSRMRPILIAGNDVAGEWRARTDDQLPSLTAELLHSRAPLLAEPLAAAAMDWATALTAAAMPEGQPFPPVFAALQALLDAVALAPAARGWAGAMARYELLLLHALGFGLSLDCCIVTGTSDDLAYVSPKSAAAVSRQAAQGYEARLLPMPIFLRDGGMPSLADALAGLALSGHFIEQRLFERRSGRRDNLVAVRERMLARLQRAIA